ncbi:MAG TPA: sigma-70 family RNA polymerase sigma factor [Longimicrobiaceae bacterium]|nr:sigma-70 family RNA polymerase sigma factor [Longimicrobiaceae bacterium]
MDPPQHTAGGRDCELVRRMAAGDQAALAALYDRWSTLVHSVAARRVADAEDAAEVVEEVFWQAWRQAGEYREGRGAVSTWLGMIARSRAHDRLRSRRRERETETPAGLAVLQGFPAADDPALGAERAERRDLVERALGTLPADQREAVELAYFRGMSQSEIAAHTGQPLGTVKTRARLALQKLREKLSALREAAP